MKTVLSTIVMALCFAAAVQAETWRFSLNDGSVVVGEMSGFANGHYTITSPTLGRISLAESKVRSVVRVQDPRTRRPQANPYVGTPTYPGNRAYTNNPYVPQSPPSGRLSDSITAMPPPVRAQILNDPKSLNAAIGLQNHPSVKNILSNPQAMEMIRRGDYEGLASDPNVQQLLKDPAMQGILSRVR